MKKLTFVQASLVCLAAITISTAIFFSCKKNSAVSSDVPQTVTLTQGGKLSNGTILPAGTTVSTIPGNPHSLEIGLPAGYTYVGYQVSSGKTITSAAMVELSTVTVTCTCNKGTGCNPFTAGGNVGCSTSGTCTSCTMTVVGKTSEPILNGGIVYAAAPHFVTTSTELNGMRSAFKAMFELPDAQKALQQFQGYVDPKDIPAIQAGHIPEGYSNVPISIYGRLAYALVRTDRLPASATALAQVAVASTSYSCSCTSGSGCSLESSNFGAVHYCNAGSCTVCSLTIVGQK